MRVFAVVLCAVLALPARAELVVVLPVTGDEREGSVMPGLRTALASLVTVQAAATTAESLAAAKALGLSCDTSKPACMAELGGLANADLAIGGALERTDEGAVVQLRLIEVASTRERRSSTLVVPYHEPARARALRLLAVRLVAPERERGELVVRAPQGATIVVDGVTRGTAPLAGPIVLVPGRHDVYVALLGRVSANQTVEVTFDDSAILDVELVRDGTTPTFAHEPFPGAGRTEPIEDERPISRVAITSVDAPGVDADVAREVATALANEIGKLERTTVLRVGDVPDLLEPATAVMLACREAACNRLVSEQLEVDTLVHVDIRVDATQSRLGIQRVDGTSGHVLSDDARVVETADGEELVQAVTHVVQKVFVDRHLRAGERRGPVASSIVKPPRQGLPRWVFFSSLAATGTALGAAGGLLLWSSIEDDPATKGALELSMWIAVGATAALAAADVAIGLSTE